jgi:hypothetical protein
MVFISDEGSVFDAPVDKVWKYLSSDQHKHGGMKMISREVNGNAITLTSERIFMGRNVQTKVRNTLYPPIGFVQEVLEGPLEGSRAFILYLPKGDKTGISVVGDYKLRGVEGEQATREAVLASSLVSFDEDNANIKKMT